MLELKLKHLQLIEELIETSETRREIEERFLELYAELEEVLKENPASEAVVVTFGESFLSLIFSKYLEEQGTSNTLLDAKTFMHVSNVENPEIPTVNKLLKAVLQREVTSEVYVTQGFVRIDRNKNISTLKRGGSDYTATIIGAAVNAAEVQIWTDIDGFHNNCLLYTSPSPRDS